MSEFLDVEAEVEGDYEDEIDRYENEESSDDSLIDNECEGNELSFYRSVDHQLENVGDIDKILREELEEQYKEAENLEPNNLVHERESLNSSKIKSNSTQYLNTFKATFFPVNNGNLNNLTFKQALQYAVRFFKQNLTDTCQNFENNIANQFDNDLKIELDLNKFENTCYHIN